MSKIKITNVKSIHTAPENLNLVVVKIETSEPGLYGLGCATFFQRHLGLKSAIDDYLKPFLLGRDPNYIEDIWQTSLVDSYWRYGPILNNALSGVDMALWDIKGKLAGMPVYELLGGKCREAVPVYRHADGVEMQQVVENIQKYIEQGYKYVRCQLGAGYGGQDAASNRPDNALPGAYYDPDLYSRSTIKLFEYVRKQLGYDIELLHDIHERVAPMEAIRMAKQLEPFRLFFLEDMFPPEQIGWFEIARQQVAVPLAMGELFNNPNEWLPLIQNRLIDFIRCHISAIGGITPARKLAALCDAFGIRTAWHGPGDVSPIGHVANLHLDMSSYNFGIQEWPGMSDALMEVFPGCPTIKNGYAYVNDKPGLGIDIDEKKAAKYPAVNNKQHWLLARKPDGSSAKP